MTTPLDLVAIGAARLGLRSALITRVGDEPMGRFVRGRGYLIGIEFVRDRATREPLPPERAFSQVLGKRVFADGLIIYACAGNVGGRAGDTVIVAPPYNASAGELAELVEKLARAVERTLA